MKRLNKFKEFNKILESNNNLLNKLIYILKKLRKNKNIIGKLDDIISTYNDEYLLSDFIIGNQWELNENNTDFPVRFNSILFFSDGSPSIYFDNYDFNGNDYIGIHLKNLSESGLKKFHNQILKCGNVFKIYRKINK